MNWALGTRRIYNKSTNIHAFQVPEGGEKGGRTGKVFKEIMAKNLPNLTKKEISLQIQH